MVFFRTFFLLFFFISILSSCDFSRTSFSLNSNITILVQDPTSFRPVLYPPTTDGMVICRPRPFRFREFREAFRSQGVGIDVLDNILGEEEEEGEEGRNGADNDPTRLEVDGYWLNFGLEIQNHNRGENNFYLVINRINYSAVAVYRGQTRTNSGTISVGYCGNEEDTPNFLYIVPPISTIGYDYESKNPLYNLTIVIDGFPVEDRTGRLSPSEQRRLDIYGRDSSSSDSSPDSLYPPNELIFVPGYTVELTFSGTFLKPNRSEPNVPFSYRTRFRTLPMSFP